MPEYRFRPLIGADMPILAEWLRQPDVARWWPDPERQIALIQEDRGVAPMRQLIAMQGDTALGYAQYYTAHHWPAPHFSGLPPQTVAIDLFSSPEGMGHGGAWLRALGDQLLEAAPVLAIDPAPENARAIRAYEKAGFTGTERRRDSKGAWVTIMTRRR